MKKCLERLYNGLIKENPTFVLMLGMCPTLAVTTSAINGLGMGLSTMVVLALSNLIISALRKIIPDKVRIPAYIVIIATFVTVVELLMHAYLPGLYSSLGIYISLIVVNCIILGRAESYASKNSMIPSLFDGIGMGLGFTIALTIIGLVREFLGGGTLFGVATATILGDSFGNILNGLVPTGAKGFGRVITSFVSLEFTSFSPVGIFVMAPGAFFVLAALTAIQNMFKDLGAKKGKDTSKIQSGCNSDCMNCADSGCSRRFVEPEKEVVKETVEVAKTEENVSDAESLSQILNEEEAQNE
ncbi:MAG: electron transport complex subunit E [Lachnospiraceae bacterium]|nr:electron transport complex subunit E [Lachnospiraceae bacterium]